VSGTPGNDECVSAVDDGNGATVRARGQRDIINVAGHCLSTGGVEEVRAAHPDVAECAVIGVADALKGQD
jgi:propionyl-CoA synthetase